MSQPATIGAAPIAGRRARVDESVVALFGIYFLLATLFAWQAWRRETPTIFTDELEMTQLSRAIADHGWPARRGESYGFTTLVPWLTAPFWWLHSVSTAYETIKYVQALVMALAIFPAYGIARMVVSRPWALFAAAGTIAAPALSYAPILVEEPWVYPIATMALWLTVRAVDSLTWRNALLAVGACVLAAATRSQLVVLLLALALALLSLAWSAPGVRAWRQTWSRWDWVGAATLAVGVILGLSALAGHLSYEWEFTMATGLGKGRILDYGLWAGGAFAIGLGVVPAIALLTTALLRGEDRARPGAHAFVAVATAAVIGFGWYAALKGAYLSMKFSSLIVERNLLYLTPLALTATAYVLSRARPAWWAIVASGCAVGLMIVATPIDRGLDSFPYYEAHGLAILALANREWSWPLGRIDAALVVVVVAGTLVLLAVTALREQRRRLALGLAIGTAAVVGVWGLTAEIYASIGEHDFSSRVSTGLPKPNNWVDRLAKGGTVVMFGQQMGENPVGNASTEFWNRSIVKVWSVDGTAPPPGPTLTPDLVSIDGTLAHPPGTDYILALEGVEVAGQVVGRAPDGSAELVRLDGPIRLRANQVGVSADGWMVGDPGDGKRTAEAAYNRFDVSQDGPGEAVVRLSRQTACYQDTQLPGLVRVRIGPLGVGTDKEPAISRVTAEKTVYVPTCATRDVALPAPGVPWRVEVVSDTFVPAEVDPRLSERRELGARISFAFRPTG